MTKVKCPVCGEEFEYDPNDPYCPKCGSVVPTPSAAPPTPSAAPPAVKKAVVYTIMNDGKKTKVAEIYEGGSELVLGRKDLANYAWRDPDTISRVHLKVKFENGKFLVRDDQSTNGTYIDGKDIRSQGYIEVQAGKEIILVNPQKPVVKLTIEQA
ncbi:FHA domain-containing protein [Candidatus Methanodesulfokora washburnensis]|jgi:hypothetical protein|uniref:FHA domain-containing protein n=1 Tax=Candidatus Methanodesulfokora washburnensis TaxID=2478471 RepID=A0A3R9RM39_9CREN|nr:FHA domain-containing protein [Candidatus Methanodesulfokores washburnensis]RSN73473.1 FHA domain-containing protein [Candidatus Methanodesulfokores washburnensis]